MENNSLYNKDLMCGRFYPKVIAYYFKEWNDFRMSPGHAHNQVEIMYVISGTCSIQADSKTFWMKKGEFILIDANVHHNLIVEKDRPCRMLNIEFVFTESARIMPSFKDAAGASEVFRKFLESKAPFVFLRDLEDIYPAFKNLISELDSSELDKDIIIQLLLSQILIKIARLAVEHYDNTNTGAIYVRKALKFMQQNYDQDIKVEDIAAAVNLHPIYLHRIFKAEMSVTLLEYLTKLRLDKAMMFLENTDVPIIDICGYVGINSRQYFSYVFKKQIGVTPQAYRKTVNKIAVAKKVRNSDIIS